MRAKAEAKRKAQAEGGAEESKRPAAPKELSFVE